MVSAVAFCPQAPALVPDVGRGLDAELGEVRAACRTAIRRVAAPAARLVVLGSGPRNASFGPTSRGSLAAFGADLVVPLGSDADGPTDLPPSLTVGAWLVRDAVGPDSGATAYSVAPDDGDLPLMGGDDGIALVVIGDGSARRSEKAPGYLDDHAGAFDAYIARAMAHGEGDALHFPSGDDDLLAAGVPVWDAVSWLIETQSWDADLLYDDAPFGVGYFVAAWTLREPAHA